MSGAISRILYAQPVPAGAAAPPPRPAAFLDRDGVLNIDHGHVHRRADFDWLPGAAAAVKRLNLWGYLVVVVTNQSGIARGLYDVAAFKVLSDWMVDELAGASARVEAVFYCPHHPSEGQGALRRVCDCRKPAPGMLLAAIAEFSIDAARSVLIGDKDTDLQAASAAGVRGLKFPGGDLDEFVRAKVNPPA
jgi:D-glycero-D-manno-heptose 1,7-bisphosphate phosphatase